MKLRNENKQESTAEPKGGPSTSTERSWRHRESIYKRKDAHEQYKAKADAVNYKNSCENICFTGF